MASVKLIKRWFVVVFVTLISHLNSSKVTPVHSPTSWACVFCQQFLSDNGESRQEAAGEREIFSRRLCSTRTEFKPWTECLCSSVNRAFPAFYLLYHCIEIGIFLFLYFWGFFLFFSQALNSSDASLERGLSKNICPIYHKSLPGDVLSLLPGGSI